MKNGASVKKGNYDTPSYYAAVTVRTNKRQASQPMVAMPVFVG